MLHVCTAQADTFGSGSNEFTIDFVAIGSVNNPADTVQNAGNQADTNRYGAVSYAYRISTYEISEDIVAKATNNGLANVTAARWGADRPAANISWYEAAAFVNWLNTSKGYSPAYNLVFTNGAWSMQLWDSTNAWTAGGTNLYRHKDSFYFLPSINEWYKAAYYNPAGSNYFLYPTAGNSPPASVAGGTNPGTAVYLRDTGQGPAAATNAGGLSPSGTMGQGGNVWDWLETASDGTNNSPTENRQSRGGLYFSVTASLASTSPAIGQSPTEQSFGTGFRVASIRVTSTNAYLGDLSLSGIDFSPNFTPETKNYAADVDNTVASIVVAPTASDPAAVVTVNGSSDLDNPVNLDFGSNTILIVVTAEDGTTVETYTLIVTRAPDTTAPVITLLGEDPITITRGSFFTDPGAAVADNVDAAATIYGSGSVDTSVAGTYTLTYSATDAAGNVATPVTRTVNVVNSTNANLDGLTISIGSLEPAFSGDTTSYAASVANTAASLTITATTSDPTASLTLNGAAVLSGNPQTVRLNVGSTEILVLVTAQDDATTKTYTISVNREVASVETWTETFGSGTNTFTIYFVDIGNTNNPADASGYGAVPYGYRMATYEVPQDAIAKAAASGLSNVTAGAWTGNRPAANVSWLEAAAFVNWLNTSKGYQRAYNMVFTNGSWTVQPWNSAVAWTAGGTNLIRHKDAQFFLPNENEWYKAAYYDGAGTNYFPYPTAGSKIPTAVGNGTTAGTAVYNGVTNTPAEVVVAGGLSPYGTMGQGGNVSEWNESTLDGSTNSTIRIVRGGNWAAFRSALLSSARNSAIQSDQNSTIGFRVATVQPKPSQGFTEWAQGVPLTPENLLEYAIGGASGPNSTDGIAMVPSVGPSNLCVNVIVRTNDSLLAVSGQNIGNLSTGAWDAGSVTLHTNGVDQTGVPPGFQRQRFCAPHGSDGGEFIRLIVGLVPSAPPQAATTSTDTFGSGTNAFAIDFVHVGNAGNPGDGPSEPGSVPYEYRIGKYEVSQAQINKAIAGGLAFVTAGPWTGEQPAANITWFEAAAFVNWLNTNSGYQAAYDLRFTGTWEISTWHATNAWTVGGTNRYRHKNARYFLPSDTEWYKAAYYNPAEANYFEYPTGSDARPSAVSGGTNPGTAVYIATAPAAVTNAGGLSPYGTMGQGGNVDEWNETLFNVQGLRIVTGGSYLNDANGHVNMRAGNLGGVSPTGENNSRGFRISSLSSVSTQISNSNTPPPQ